MRRAAAGIGVNVAHEHNVGSEEGTGNGESKPTYNEGGDVVRFYHPTLWGVNGAKRVIGMPGDFVCRDLPFSTEDGKSQEMIQVCFFICLGWGCVWMLQRD